MVFALLLSTLAPAAEPVELAAARCPLHMPEQTARADVRCIAESGANWTFAFAYPATAARIPALDRLLRARRAAARADLELLIAYAAEHPDGRFYHEEVFTTEADLPELLALSSTVAEHAGGNHGWRGHGTLIWDRVADREIALADLFENSGAAEAELERLFCPTFLHIRRRRFERNGGRFDGTCDGPPEQAALAAGPAGRIDTLHVSYAELEGYPGGRYDVYLPVTERLIAAMHARYRSAFAPSRAAPLGCSSRLSDPNCDERQRQ